MSACADLNSRDALQELTGVMSRVSGAHLTITDLLSRQAGLLDVSCRDTAVRTYVCARVWLCVRVWWKADVY